LTCHEKRILVLTLSDGLKAKLKQVQKSGGYKSIPKMLESFVLVQPEKILLQEKPQNSLLFENKWCGERDSNPRTPTRQPPQGCAFDLAWQPPPFVQQEIT
jgi:hypothetical protein